MPTLGCMGGYMMYKYETTVNLINNDSLPITDICSVHGHSD